MKAKTAKLKNDNSVYGLKKGYEFTISSQDDGEWSLNPFYSGWVVSESGHKMLASFDQKDCIVTSWETNMTREIKFRYYDKQTNSLVYSDEFEWPNTLERLAKFFAKAATYADSVQQFTGIKDNQGNDIYEGDIVEQFLGNYDPYEQDIFYSREGNVFVINCDLISGCFELQNEQPCKINVIGNTFQNRELLIADKHEQE